MQGRLPSTSTNSKGRRPRADPDCQNVQCSSSSQKPADYTSCVSRRSHSPQHPARYNSQIPRSSCSPQKLSGSKSRGDGSGSNASPQQSTFASRRNTCSKYGAYSNPTPKFQTSTSSVCLTPPTPTSRASTPPQRCHSAPRNRQLSSGGRGAESPGKTKHRRSLSSKIEAWQFDIPEQPSNLRRTLANRSTSRGRGSGISSRHGSETGNRPSQRSVPPTFSKPANSSKIHDSDHLSSHSKSSVVSSFDDEIDSINSVISEKKLVMKTTYRGDMVRHQVTSRQELDANMREPVSKVQAKPSVTDVSGGSKCLMLQTDSCENSKSMLRSLLPTAPVYIHKESSLQYQTDSMNSSVTTRNNCSSGQGACLIPSTEGSDQGIEDVGNKPVKSLASIWQKEMPVLDKMPVKCENGSGCSIGHMILPSNGTTYPEKGFGRDFPVNVQEQGAGIKISEVSSSKVDTGNLCEALLDSRVNVMNTQCFKESDGYSSYQDLHLGHQELVEDRANTSEVRNVLLQLNKMFALNSSGSVSTPFDFVDCQENKYSKCIRTENFNDGTLQDLHRVELRNYEIENTEKHDHGSSEDVAMYEIKSNQANETDVVMHKFSAKELTESNHTNLISKVEEVEEFICGEGRGNLELLDAPSYILDRDSFHHKVELSSGDLVLGESPSKGKDYKEPVLPLQAVSASSKLPNNVKGYNKQVLPMETVSPNILGDYSGLRRSQNDKKSLTVYQTNDSVSDTYMMEQMGDSDSSKVSGKEINSESITNALRINTLSDANISTSIPQSNGHQKLVRSDNVNDEVCIDYFLDMFETPNTVEAMTLRPTSSASNSMRGMNILFGESILPAVTKNNMNQVAVHTENVGDEACIDTHFDDFQMKHTPDSLRGLPDGLEKITSLSSITMLSCARIPTTRLDSNTHQTSVHCQNVNEKACIDQCQDDWEIAGPAMKETFVHYEAASGGLSNGIQDENLNSLLANGSICFLQGHSPAVDIEAYVDRTATICKQDDNRLHNDISSLGKHVHSHDCMNSCQQSRNFHTSSLQAAYTTMKEETQLLVVSPEEEKETITDVHLERDTCFSIQQASDLRALNESATARERKRDGMQVVKFNFQPESTRPTADLPALQTEEKTLELGGPKGNTCNKFSDVNPKNLSNQANAYEAHFYQGKIGMDTNASAGYLSRTLTLAEATDTVLFCSSIVYDLIDKATAIVMDKEKFNSSPMSVKKHRHRNSYGDTSFKPSKDKSTRQQVAQSSPTVVHGNSKPVIQVVTIPQRDAIAHARRKNPKCCCSII